LLSASRLPAHLQSAHLHVETPDSSRRLPVYRLNDRHAAWSAARAAKATRVDRAGSRRQHRAGYERAKEMFRTVNGEKAKRLTPKTKTAVFTILWIVLVCGAMAFIAFAGHI
jgi:hypothetical protein